MQNQQSAQARLHTPTQSFSEGGQALDPIAGSAAGAASGSKATANWSDKKFREEYDLARARLSDQKFNMKDYEDPLLPRQHPQSKYYPNGVTAELEAHLQAVIANAKASSE
ncbi:hypothetical protein F4809DRAFT_165374 [Biscogniauxia mediterranea]|nr:hypothetical protein F4809DRAFT_165374 [Biscogniauxia mediterranea]